MAAKKKSVRKKAAPSAGERLLDQVVRLTGLDSQAVKKELQTLLAKKNLDVNQLTLEQLRHVIASYMREIMMGILDRAESPAKSREKPDQHH